MKRVELRAGVDPLTGAVVPDPASAGPSPADEAALEWALRIAEAAGTGVAVVTVGGPECDSMLRGAIGAGAERAVRVPVGREVPDGLDPPSALEPPSALDPPSPVVAAALARAVAFVAANAGAGASSLAVKSDLIVCCGDASVDRGSGSVPAFLAGELTAAQALGLVGVSLEEWTRSDDPFGGGGGGDGGRTGGRSGPGQAAALVVARRLDRGRRERLRLTPPCVISVEAGTARLRRASLQRSLTSRQATVEVLPVFSQDDVASHTPVEVVSWEAYRPRTRIVPPPEPGLGPRERIAALTGALHERPSARTLVLDAGSAADELLATLAEWGELPEGLGDVGPTATTSPEVPAAGGGPEHTEPP